VTTNGVFEGGGDEEDTDAGADADAGAEDADADADAVVLVLVVDANGGTDDAEAVVADVFPEAGPDWREGN
jgi:hypothetical protein